MKDIYYFIDQYEKNRDYFVGNQNLDLKFILDIINYQFPNDDKKNNDQYGDRVHRRYFENEDDFILGYISKFFDLHIEQQIFKKKQEIENEVDRIDVYDKLNVFKKKIIEEQWESYLVNIYYGYDGKKAVKFVYEKNEELLKDQNENFAVGCLRGMHDWKELSQYEGIFVLENQKDEKNSLLNNLSNTLEEHNSNKVRRPTSLFKYFENKKIFYDRSAKLYDVLIKAQGKQILTNEICLKTLHEPVLD